jgi:hypothetical protein
LEYCRAMRFLSRLRGINLRNRRWFPFLDFQACCFQQSAKHFFAERLETKIAKHPGGKPGRSVRDGSKRKDERRAAFAMA